MTSTNLLSQARLFRFKVPGIGIMLTVAIEQMVGVAYLPFITRIPAVPPSVLGIGRWQESPVVLLDMQRVLAPQAVPRPLEDVLSYHQLIIRTAIHNQISLIGCPILAGGQIVSVPMSLPRADAPAWVAPRAVHQAVIIDGTQVLLLDTLNFPTLLTSPETVQ